MKVHTHALRVLHKWIGLIIGLQFLLWTISGTAMAILDMKQVAGGPERHEADAPRATADGWAAVQKQLVGTQVTGLSLRARLGRQVYEVSTPVGTRLFDAGTGQPLRIDAQIASRVANAAYAGTGSVESVVPLDEITLAVREHRLPIWRVDFDDEHGSSFYVSGSNGALLERRNDSWRLWDFFWMLHNMDYAKRTSFNHPLIIMVGFAAVWLAITGFYLLFRTGWRSDFKGARGRRVHAEANGKVRRST